MVLWSINLEFKVITFLPALMILMAFVGLLGGACYVNVMYKIMNSHELSSSYKELATSIAFIFNDVGVLSASLLSVYISAYMYAEI